MANQIQIRRGLVADLPILASGEFGFTTDTKDVYIGDGSSNTKITNAASGMEWSLISTNTTAVSGNGYLINATTGNITLTLPSSPTEGDSVGISDAYSKATTNTITIARNSENISGNASDLVLGIAGVGYILMYADSTQGWVISSDGGVGDNTGLFEIDVNGGLMPVTDNLSDNYYELDGNDDIMPQVV